MAALVDAQGRVVDANRTFLAALGMPAGGGGGPAADARAGADPLAGLAPADLGLPGPGEAAWVAWFDPARPLASPIEAPLVRVNPSGAPSAPQRWIRWTLTRVIGTKGDVRAMALVGTDCTERRRSDRRVRRLSDFYRALSDMGQAMLRLTDPAALHDAICRIAVESGGAAMAWIGLVEDGRLAPAAWAGAAAEYTEGLVIPLDAEDTPQAPLGPSAWAVRHGRAYVVNDYLADPRTRPWHARTARFGVRSCAAFPFHRGGRIAGTLNLYFTEAGAFDDELTDLLAQLVSDLSFALEHVDAEAARRQAERAARERERQLTGIVESALDAIVALDHRLDVVLFNDAASRMFGVSREDVIGRPVDRFVPPEWREAHRGFLLSFAQDSTHTRRMGAAREIVGLRADGSRFPMEASISRTGEGDRCLLTMMARDVTLLRQAEKAQLAHAAAEAANRAKTEFLSRISHELRTPLNAVLGFARLMAADAQAPLPASQRERLDRVLLAGEHLRELMDEVLDVTSIEAGRLSIESKDFELRALVSGVVALCEPQAREAGVRIEVADMSGPHVPLRSDPGRVRQVLLNLLTNAIKYNRRGGRVDVAVERQGDAPTARLVVRDDGVGMTEAQRAQLYQPFNRLGRERSDVPGSGIGLVLVRQLVDLMGGTLSIESEAGRGTTVVVTLPVATTTKTTTTGATMIPTSTSPPAPATSSAPAARAADEPRGVVLYIEDNPINAMLVEQLLARWRGVQLVVAGDGASGLERARTLQPRVILLDLQLPDLDGLEVLRRLKADPQTRDLTVVALSADAVPAGIRAAREAGALDYWTKPIDFDAFLPGMRRLLAP